MSETPLSPHQRRLLRKTFPLPAVLSEFGDSDKQNFQYLCSIGLVEDQGGILFITEKGRAFLSDRRYTVLKDWLPIGISVLALIISIIALLK